MAFAYALISSKLQPEPLKIRYKWYSVVSYKIGLKEVIASPRFSKQERNTASGNVMVYPRSSVTFSASIM